MANYNNLLSTINGAIRTNGTGAITGQLLQTILDGMVASLGAKYQYAGLATPATNPGTPDENVFYLATQAGTYTNFGGLVVNDGEVCALKWDGAWAKEITGAATAEQVSQLGQECGRISPAYPNFTLSSVKSYPGIINSSSNWVAVNQHYKHIIIPCKEGDMFEIHNAYSQALFYAFLNNFEYDVVNAQPADIAGTLRGIGANTTTEVTAPSGAVCLTYPVLYNDVDTTPTIFKINGYDLCTTLVSKLAGITEKEAEDRKNTLIELDTFANRKLDDFLMQDYVLNNAGLWVGSQNAYKHILIKVRPGDTLTIYGIATNYCAFLNSYQVAINGESADIAGSLKAIYANRITELTAPAGAVCFAFSVLENNVNVAPTSLKVNGYDYATTLTDKLLKIPEFITETYEYVVDINGTGDFTSLRDCFSTIGGIIGKAGSSRPAGQTEWCDTVEPTHKIFNVRILPGIYDVRGYYTNEEWASPQTLGLIVPRGVNLIGMGKKRSDVIITCTSETSDSAKSTLNIQNDVTIANLTIKGNNVRYVVHDDYSFYPYSNKYGDMRVVKDVDLIGENLLYANIWGAGTKGGANWKFENCTFVNKDSSCGFAVHDRNGNDQTAPEQFILENCNFFGKYVESRGNLIFAPITGGCDENVILIGCVFNAIQINTSSGVTPTTIYDIKGNGNSKDYEFYTDSDFGKLSIPKFADECIPGYNTDSTDIYIGDYVVNVNGQFTKGTSSNYSGIALEDIPIGESGLIKINP